MSNLIVVSFNTESGAADSLGKFHELEKHAAISIDNAATAVRHFNGKVKVKQLHESTKAGAVGGTFWGALFGLIFFVPFLGMSMSAATGALFGKSNDFGLNDEFIQRVSDSFRPGCSALFMLENNSPIGQVLAQLDSLGGEIIYTTLSSEEEERLKESFT